MARGLFFVLEGVDGVGKTTQQRLFCQWLAEQGKQVVACRDPGGTALGERVREILLGRHELAIERRTEMLLYMASRAQLMEEVIRPALDQGKVVVSDRFVLSNVVYQGHAGGLSPEEVRQVGQIATQGIAPSLTFLLEMPADRALARIGRAHDRMESQGLAYLEKVVAGYRTEAARAAEARASDPRAGAAICRINADQEADEVQRAIREAAHGLLDAL